MGPFDSKIMISFYIAVLNSQNFYRSFQIRLVAEFTSNIEFIIIQCEILKFIIHIFWNTRIEVVLRSELFFLCTTKSDDTRVLQLNFSVFYYFCLVGCQCFSILLDTCIFVSLYIILFNYTISFQNKHFGSCVRRHDQKYIFHILVINIYIIFKYCANC